MASAPETPPSGARAVSAPPPVAPALISWVLPLILAIVPAISVGAVLQFKVDEQRTMIVELKVELEKVKEHVNAVDSSTDKNIGFLQRDIANILVILKDVQVKVGRQ